jgi:predicted CXXCH cytochrome family protein
MKNLLAAGLLALATPALAAEAAPAGSGVTGSKHDFTQGAAAAAVGGTAQGPGSRCFFCHASHGGMGGAAKLSNRPDVQSRAQGYQSSTMVGRAETVSGASKACLSCHDGTVAPGRTRAGTAQAAATPLPAGSRSNLGTDLRGSHPVSIRPPPTGRLQAPTRGDRVRLDQAGLVQCTSCHDPHAEWGDPAVGKFLVKPSGRSALCASCHVQAALGSHATATLPVRDPKTGRSTPLAEAGCGACHVSHGADPRTRLLPAAASDDAPCLACHATATTRPLGQDLVKLSAHPSSPRGLHDEGEGPFNPGAPRLPETSPATPRHAACVDCHDPHVASATPAIAPFAGGALAGAWGIGLDGQRVAPARYEYELCLKCHGDSANKPQAAPGVLTTVRRERPDLNLRLVFAPSAASYHPVAAPSRNGQVPGLKAPLTGASQIYCTDCHASDQGRGAGGTGPRGPHGSIYAPLLERRYLTADRTPEGPDAYALCYKCHDRDVLLSDRSGFPSHRRHVVDQATPCSACHDAHGVSAMAGSVLNNAHLVAFDLSIVRAAPTGVLRYEAAGQRGGTCTLTCHDVTHGPSAKVFGY